MHQYTVKILQFKNVHNLNWKFISGDIAVNLSQLCQAQQGSRVGVTAPVGLHLEKGFNSGGTQGPLVRSVCTCVSPNNLGQVIQVTGCW